MDLFSVAAGNGDAVQGEFESIRSALPPPEAARLNGFAQRVQQGGRISINMRQWDILSFLVSGSHQNIHEWACSRAGRSTKPAEQILKEKLGPFYERRVAFDRHFDRGEQYRYGALNIGGLGLKSFGTFCAVLADEVSSGHDEVAYLRGDSLKTYMKPGPAVDEDGIRRDATPHTHRHFLATCKHASEAPGTPDGQWPAMLCSSSHYVEVIFTQRITPNDLDAVRMPRSEHELFFEYAFEEFRERLTDADRILTGSFAMILDRLDDHGVRLEVLDDD